METQDNGFMMFVAEHSDIDPNDLEKLFYNGFDNPESLSMLTIEQLTDLGLSDATTVLAKVEATLEVYHELLENGGKLGQHADPITEQSRDIEAS
jgi:hypothetical protein